MYHDINSVNIPERIDNLLRKLMKKIDMFCYKHPNFGIPNLMLFIVIGNAIVWLFSMMDATGLLANFLAFDPALILRGQIWRLITFVFIPDTYGLWALLFFYFYYWIGGTLERRWGTPRFNIFVLTGVVLTIIYGFIIYFATGVSYPVDAYYIYMSMFFSFATLFPDMQVLLFFIIPVKIKWLAYIDAVYFLLAIITMPFPINLLPLVAMLNYFIFFGESLLNAITRGRARYSKKTVSFKREVNKINREKESMPYTRKCAVCGKTDTEYPNLEFRYCSRCAGYHCFCSEHINSHVHFTE